MKTLKNDIPEACKVEVDCLKDSESDVYDNKDMKEKLNDLVRLHKAIQEKLKTTSFSERIQILALVPDQWSGMYCSESFNFFEYLVWTSLEIKKIGGILAKSASKKVKTIATETLHLVTNIYQNDNFGR